MQKKTSIDRLLIKKILEVGKPYKIKKTPQFVGIYKNVGTLFWAASIGLHSQSLDQIQLALNIKIKPTEFDDIDAIITRPGTDLKCTDSYRANPGYHFFTISQKIYSFDSCIDVGNEKSNQDDALLEISQVILSDILREVENFTQIISTEYGDIYHYFIAKSNKEPMYAGLSHICFREYEKAIDCFELADEKKKFPHLSIRKHGRYFHQVCCDYCKALSSGIEWKDEYVVNGLPWK